MLALNAISRQCLMIDHIVVVTEQAFGGTSQSASFFGLYWADDPDPAQDALEYPVVVGPAFNQYPFERATKGSSWNARASGDPAP